MADTDQRRKHDTEKKEEKREVRYGKAKEQEGRKQKTTQQPQGGKPSTRKQSQSQRNQEVGADFITVDDKEPLDVIVCQMCKQSFEDMDDKLISCDRCDRWFCLTCSSLDPQIYDFLNNETMGNSIMWLCEECKAPAIRAVKTDMEIEARCTEFLSKFQVEMKEEINLVKTEVREMKLNQETNMKEMKKEVIEEAIKEVRERQERSLNLIFYNISESNTDDPEENKKEDAKKVSDILNTIGVDVQVTNLTRLGKKEENNRPIRVRTANSGDMAKILGAAKKLRDIEEMDNIYINKDRTPLERAQWKQLMEERKEKNSEAKEAGMEENDFLLFFSFLSQPRKYL
jgi:hypothetical protein